MNNPTLSTSLSSIRENMRDQWLDSDVDALKSLLQLADIGVEQRRLATDTAYKLVAKIREEEQESGLVAALLNEFALSSDEGVVLMCLAEALLRVPDTYTADKLIRDKLKGGDWASHLGKSHSLFVNAAAWGLLLTGKLVNYTDSQQLALHSTLTRIIGRLGQPLIRTAMRSAMGIMGNVFVMGRTMEEAIKRAQKMEEKGFFFSYDMLGEGARTAEAAKAYFQSYESAIHQLGRQSTGLDPERSPSISVKLSALHPRFEFVKKERVMRELVPQVLHLAKIAKRYDIGFTIDAEEAARLDLSLDVIEAVYSDKSLVGWRGFGVAVQAYQKRAPHFIDWLEALAQRCGRRMMVRLVKGAYWDSEIKSAQVDGIRGYPVFTRKPATDVCYQACARKLLACRESLFPQFATHNAWTVAAILAMAGSSKGYEFQRLHGMGEGLYDQVMTDAGIPCRIYAPVGEHKDLLAYLARRLLENGANSSFVNNIVDDRVSIESLIKDPVLTIRGWRAFDNPAIPAPAAIFGAARKNSSGIAACDISALRPLCKKVEDFKSASVSSVQGEVVCNPARTAETVGFLTFDSAEQMRAKLERAHQCFEQSTYSAEQRGRWLNDFADALESNSEELIALCVHEAGKTIFDGIAEVREAVDFCRYYASECIKMDDQQKALGVVLCISPWNFPLAIFVGQLTAAVAAGNVVLAKPAEQTSLIALRAIELFRASGLPVNIVQCVVGKGADAGAVLVSDRRIKAVMFTGSTATGRWLFDTLAMRADAPVPLIAETGGQNCMIVDSTALPEQVVTDIIRSGFASAGQRCSALRVLYLQDDIADNVIEMLCGAMNELQIGDPQHLATDVGPVIDNVALENLQKHVVSMSENSSATLLHKLDVPFDIATSGYYFAPHLYEISSMDVLQGEVFGPVVHVVRYQAAALDDVIEQINASGFGLTLGVHSRIGETAAYVAKHVQVGNLYVNRDMIGAVVGVQPFGGRGLSGTGPKAGGPLTINRLACLAGDATITSDCGSSIMLDGPTGETNQLMFEPKGKLGLFYCESDSKAHCLQSIATAMKTGNSVVLFLPQSWRAEIVSELPAENESNADSTDIEISNRSMASLIEAVDAFVVEPSSQLLPALLSTLAGKSGAIPCVICEAIGPHYWERFVLEKVVTTNTTAAGGNASLMTIAES